MVRRPTGFIRLRRHHEALSDDDMMPSVRTTLTLDADVESLIRRSMADRGLGFKAAVNEAIRQGLASRPNSRFKQRTFAMGFRPDISYDKALRIAGALEDEEVIRKLAAGR